MGMGGSSLAPDVFHRTFGTTEGYLDLRILDSTDPAAVGAVVDDLDPLETLWIVASKSGTTTEPLAFLADAWSRVEAELEAPRLGPATRRVLRGDHRPGARASRRSPTTTSCASGSSTRRTSAGGTRR